MVNDYVSLELSPTEKTKIPLRELSLAGIKFAKLNSRSVT